MSSTRTRYHWTPEQKEAMKRLYVEAGFSLEDIAVHAGCTRETIRHHLKKQGVEFRGPGCTTEHTREKQRGENHWNWQGGRHRRTSPTMWSGGRGGYVLERHPEHPYANQHGYVLQHRIAVERDLQANDPGHPALGQDGYLRQDWVVHHRNGIKDDNRLVNLEPLPRHRHHSWMHYHEEMARLKAEVARLSGVDDAESVAK